MVSLIHIYDDLLPTEAQRTSGRTTNLGYENVAITTEGTNTDSHKITDVIKKSSKNSRRSLILFCGGLITGLVVATTVVVIAMKYGYNYSVDPPKQCGNVVIFHIFYAKYTYMWWFFCTISFCLSFCSFATPYRQNNKTPERESLKYCSVCFLVTP